MRQVDLTPAGVAARRAAVREPMVKRHRGAVFTVCLVLVALFTIVMYFTTHGEVHASRNDPTADVCARVFGVGNTEAVARCIVQVGG